MRSKKQKGFTLIELMIVVAIIGLLASIAIPQFSKFREKALFSAVASDFRNIETAVNNYKLENYVYPNDVTPGITPSDLQNILGDLFVKNSPVGGLYDYNGPNPWPNASITIAYSPSMPWTNIEVWTRFDLYIDDGNLSTGKFRTIGDRHAYFISETL